VKAGDEEGARQMRLMMLDTANLSRQFLRINVQSPGDLFFDGRKFALRGQPPQRHLRYLEGVEDLLVEVRPSVAGDGYVCKLIRPDPCLTQAIPHRLVREPGAVFDAVEPFLFGGGDEPAITDDGC